MKRKVMAQRKLLLEIYCHLRATERGLDAVLSESWPEFRQFCLAENIERIAACCATVRGIIGTNTIAKHNLTPREWVKVFSFIRAKKTRFWVSRNLLACACEVLSSFLEFLKSHYDKPSAPELLHQRKQISCVRAVFESSFAGMKGLRQANEIQHYFRSSFLKSYSLDEILELSS
jgi:hypothetical protein